MTKAFLRYLLSLCILLLGVYSHTYGHAPAQEKQSTYLSVKSLERSSSAFVGSVHFNRTEKSTVSSVSSEKSLKIEATDIEEKDDEIASFEKLVGDTGYLTALLYSFTLLFFLHSTRTSLLFCKQLANTLSQKRYLLFRVFRI